MGWGFALSLVFHLAVLAWAVLTIQSTPELPLPETPVIEATLVTVSEVTRLKQGDPDAKILEAKQKDSPAPDKTPKEAPKPKPAAAQPPPPAAEPPPPEEAKPEPPKPEPKPDPIADKLAALPPEKAPPPTPEPTPGPTPDEQKMLEEKLEQDRKAEEQKKAEEKRKADAAKKKAEELKKKKEQDKKLAEARAKADAAKKKQFDADKLSALLNKIPDAAAPAPAASAPTQPTNKTGPTAGEREGKDTVLTAREQDLLGSRLRSQITANYTLPAGGGTQTTPVVRIKFRLKQDGQLNGEPEVVGRASDPQFALAAEAAIRAIKLTVPFDMPADKYAAWQENTVEFDVSKMLR